MLFVQGSRDELADVGADRARWSHRLGARATLAMIDDADHAFHVRSESGSDDAQVLARICRHDRAWMRARRAAARPERATCYDLACRGRAAAPGRRCARRCARRAWPRSRRRRRRRSRSRRRCSVSSIWTTPMLTPTWKCRPCQASACESMRARICSATLSAVGSVHARSSTANSSPPRRAARSIERIRASSSAATSRSSWSPAAWPAASLTALKPSRST